MAKSYFEEFDKKYNRPSMDRITVGFSGIDPARKNADDSDIELIVQEQLESRIASREEVNSMLAEIWD